MLLTLFDPVADRPTLDPRFDLLRKHPANHSARQMMLEVLTDYCDEDGNFVEQFQTTGFDARIWELYLFAAFTRSGFMVNQRQIRPDFIVSREGLEVAMEAVTANASAGTDRNTSIAVPRELTADEITDRQRHFAPLRTGSALYSKLQKKYWDLPAVIGKPFVIAIESFYDAHALQLSSSSLAQYLYARTDVADPTMPRGIRAVAIATHTHKKTIPSGFFMLPEAAHVSAVIFSNSGTQAKFSRMGHQGSFRMNNVLMVREGQCYNHIPDALTHQDFIYIVGEDHVETWTEGMDVFHNPHARTPLPSQFLRGFAAQHWLWNDGLLHSEIPLFHPYRSTTCKIIVPDSAALRDCP